MHESSIARQLLDAALAALDGAGGRVRTVRGWLGETETLSPDSLSLHFAHLARGTAAEGARLELAIEHVAARCSACGARYLPAHHLLLCPACGCTDAELLGRVGLGVTEVVVGSGP